MEWRDSVHATAWPDPQIQAEISKSDHRWLCLDCHTPLLTQMDRWPVGPRPVDNARYDSDLRTSPSPTRPASCETAPSQVPCLPHIEGAIPPPHPVRAAPAGFRGAQLCIACHQAEARYAGKTFTCAFQTGDEWAASLAAEAGENCVTCHMPIESRPAAVGGQEREARRHTWRGAGMAKVPGRYPPDDANVYGLALSAEVDRGLLVVTATNANAGRMLPTGDPERWVQVDVSFVDAAGTATPLEPLRFVSDSRLAPGVSHVERYPVPEGAVRAEVRSSNHRNSKENADFRDLGDYPTSVQTGSVTVEL